MDLFTIAKANIDDYQRTADAMSLQHTAERLHKQPRAEKPLRGGPYLRPKSVEQMPPAY